MSLCCGRVGDGIARIFTLCQAQLSLCDVSVRPRPVHRHPSSIDPGIRRRWMRTPVGWPLCGARADSGHRPQGIPHRGHRTRKESCRVHPAHRLRGRCPGRSARPARRAHGDPGHARHRRQRRERVGTFARRVSPEPRIQRPRPGRSPGPGPPRVLPAAPTVGQTPTPSWPIIPSMSTSYQLSTTCPFATRRIPISPKLACRPVAGRPISGPRLVPVSTNRTTM
jgi:hypothetical protein